MRSEPKRSECSKGSCGLKFDMSSRQKVGALDEKVELQARDAVPEGIHASPVGELDAVMRMGRSVCQPHDESNNLALKEGVALIVDLASEHCEQDRPPSGLPDESFHVGVRARRVFSWLSGKGIDREKGAWPAIQRALIDPYEVVDLRAMLAVTDAGTDNDFVEGVCAREWRVAEGGQCHCVAISFQTQAQSFADLLCVTVYCRVGKENACHRNLRLNDSAYLSRHGP
jgi:hypothetical protein